MRRGGWRLLAGVVVALAACGGGGEQAVERSPATSMSAPATTTTTVVPATTGTTGAPVAAVDACPAVPPRRDPDADRPTYRVSVRVDPSSGLVEGTQAVRFVPDLPVDSLVLRLWANAPRLAAVGTSIEVGDVRVGDEVRPTRQPEPTTLVVELGRWAAPGEAIDLSLGWRLEVGGPVNDRISRQADSLRLGSFAPLLAWEPGVGWAVEPPTSGFAESTTSPTADWDLEVEGPEGWGVVASGVEVSPGRWRAEAARDVAVAVGRFTTATATAAAPDPVTVSVSVHDGVDDPNRYLGRVVAALEAFAERYGPYPWPTYHLSITPELSGGIEFPMHVLQGSDTAGRTTSHEVAHMWFYGLVGNDQGRDPWLDEGLATWAEGRFEGTLPDMAARAIPADGAGRAAEPMTYWEARSASYYRSVYVQPAAALSRLDDELVDCALAHYVATNAHTIATPQDLWASLDATFVDWRSALAPAGLAGR
ncbi:MAG TPA: M1 family aminopeptidase [Acidimicrobiales bacterium]|nr:M1 family aminopeptidase [Acidimicrobiales bacterium]